LKISAFIGALLSKYSSCQVGFFLFTDLSAASSLLNLVFLHLPGRCLEFCHIALLILCGKEFQSLSPFLLNPEVLWL